MTLPQQAQPEKEQGLFVPDRFEKLSPRASEQNLKTIVQPVESALEKIRDIYDDMLSSGGGAFIIWRGNSGVGKSTFLQTLNLFLEDVQTHIVPQESPIQQYLNDSEPTTHALRIIVLEGREALADIKPEVLEAALHAINSFIRTDKGQRTLIAWPCNTDDLTERLVTIAKKIGAESLLGASEPVFQFPGPPNDHFTSIASKTVQVLNNGASLIDLGVSEQRALELSTDSKTIGQYLIKLRQELRINQKAVNKLLSTESCHLWVIVAAGNDPEGDVAALTRGQVLTADVERMMASTGANIVEELKKQPEHIGILGAVLDAKILYLPSITALEVMREFGSPELHRHMKDASLITKATSQSTVRIVASDLGTAFQNRSSGLRKQGAKVGSNTVLAFEKLSGIAADNDKLLNKAIGEALIASGLISAYKTEVNLGNGLVRRTDLLCTTAFGTVRVEMMWRKTTSRAEIANYVLTKLSNYGKAIKFLN
jgi:energy-coupling factor transporter ATP-binding protein EcfA2